MSSPVRLPFCVTPDEVDTPAGWHVSRIVDVYEQLPVGKRYDSRSVSAAGSVPVIDQSLRGTLGYHDDEPGVQASTQAPVVTFANHTCAMRVITTPFSVIQNVFPLIGRADICDTLYLYYSTNGRQSTEEYKGHHPAWRNSFIALPDLRTQHRIVKILRIFDDLIENNRRRVEVLEEMARAIYREWFVKFRYPGHKDVPLLDSALGPLPEGWNWGKVDDLVQIVKETVHPSTLAPDTPAVGLEHIPREQITLAEWGVARTQGSRKGMFVKGDVLFGKIRPYFHKVSVAPIDGICSTDAIIIRPSEHHWGGVVMVVSSEEFVGHATQTSNGTKMPRADWKVIGQWPIAIAPKRLAEVFTKTLQDQLGLAETLMFENRRLIALRDLLLPKLVTGQLDVSKLDLEGLIEEKMAS